MRGGAGWRAASLGPVSTHGATPTIHLFVGFRPLLMCENLGWEPGPDGRGRAEPLRGRGLILGTSGEKRSAHRASYTLELGIWHATCSECGYSVSDPARQRAAAIYRGHIKETNGLATTVIDLSAIDAPPGPLSVSA
jgi:hypothetical protein